MSERNMRWVIAILIFAIGTQVHARSSRESSLNFGQPTQEYPFVDLPADEQRPVNYLCRFPFDPENAWVPEQLAISVQVGGGSVSDGLIARHHAAPRPINTRQRGAGNLVALWSVRNVRDDRGQLTNFMLFELSLDRSTGAATMFVRPEQFSSKFRGTGTCTMRN